MDLLFFTLILVPSFFWLIRETKAFLFWLYLWQLKNYHIGRFLDHFRTEKGRRLLLNKFLEVKIILFIFVFFHVDHNYIHVLPVWLWRFIPWAWWVFAPLVLSLALTAIYSFESIRFFK